MLRCCQDKLSSENAVHEIKNQINGELERSSICNGVVYFIEFKRSSCLTNGYSCKHENPRIIAVVKFAR